MLSSALVRSAVAWAYLTKARRMPARTAAQAVQKIKLLCSALRLTEEGPKHRAVEAEVLKVRHDGGFSRVEWTEALTREPQSRSALLQKAVLLKPKVSEDEPGVIFISFEHQWAQLLRLPEVEQLAKDYTLVVSPTWSPPHTPLNVIFPELWPQPVHCLISHDDDMTTLPRLSSNYRMIPLLASSWVNEEVFNPRTKDDRDLDLVMVANFAPFKRHVRFFQALRKMPPDLRILLIGQKDGNRDEKDVLREAEAFGVRDRFELRVSMPHPQVLESLARARASIVLSKREGSCVAVAESLFADTPVGLVEGAHIGSSRFINEQTGRFLREDHLAEDIMALIESAATLQPRKRALRDGIGTRRSSEILNEHLKAHALATGQKWTCDVARLQWCPNPKRLDDADEAWADETHAAITQRFGVMIGAPRTGR
ncbi:MAG: glycosyltransferase [Verrucomicrobiota bacterium]